MQYWCDPPGDKSRLKIVWWDVFSKAGTLVVFSSSSFFILHWSKDFLLCSAISHALMDLPDFKRRNKKKRRCRATDSFSRRFEGKLVVYFSDFYTAVRLFKRLKENSTWTCFWCNLPGNHQRAEKHRSHFNNDYVFSNTLEVKQMN